LNNKISYAEIGSWATNPGGEKEGKNYWQLLVLSFACKSEYVLRCLSLRNGIMNIIMQGSWGHESLRQEQAIDPDLN